MSQSPQEKPQDPAEASQSSSAPENIPPSLPAGELQKLQEEATEYKDKYLRLLAEMDNHRKRLQKERQEITQLAAERIIVDFLHPMDNLENALKFADQMSGEVKHWALGFQMILGQFKEVLAQHGVSAISTESAEFDPHCHEAIELVETTDYPQGTIIQEFSKGYRLGTKTIRPARVKVATIPTTEEIEQKNEKE